MYRRKTSGCKENPPHVIVLLHIAFHLVDLRDCKYDLKWIPKINRGRNHEIFYRITHFFIRVIVNWLPYPTIKQ